MQAKVNIEFVLSFGNEKYRVGEPVTIQTETIKYSGVIANISMNEITVNNPDL